jgi:SAM-dependent methyltransferase
VSDPADTPTDAATIYDAFSGKYRAYSETKSDYIGAVDSLIADQLRDRAGVMLDYGAGDGVRGASLAERMSPVQFFQADISAEMVARCSVLGLAEQVFLVSDPNWSDALPPLDTVVSLWNVLGHVPNTDARRALLAELFALMATGACLCIDVNNRHYVGYGRWTSLGRRILDGLRPDYARGDIQFTWKIDGVNYPASGHFFTPAEMRDLLETAGFQIAHSASVDYKTGTVSADLTQGQLFYVARKPA